MKKNCEGWGKGLECEQDKKFGCGEIEPKKKKPRALKKRIESEEDHQQKNTLGLEVGATEVISSLGVD